MTPLELATLFHETYERLAPNFGYTTRPEARNFDETTPNGQLMVAVCGEVLQRLNRTTLEDAGRMLAAEVLRRAVNPHPRTPEDDAQYAALTKWAEHSKR